MKIDWFDRIAKCLQKRIVANVWSNGDEILCKTESAADAIADIIESLYLDQGDDILINTGYYDPVEDKNGEEDDYTGWWYVKID